jgi:hypothetical protein
MRRTKLILAVAAAMVTMLALTAGPALAADNDHHDNRIDRLERFFDNFDNGLFQSNEQEADSGDVDQSFDVSGGGDNSNQTVGTQGVANTGNAQNQIGVTRLGNNLDNFNRHDLDRFDRFVSDHFDRNSGDFEFEDSGASIEVSPTNTTSGDQQVNQAASAFGR